MVGCVWKLFYSRITNYATTTSKGDVMKRLVKFLIVMTTMFAPVIMRGQDLSHAFSRGDTVSQKTVLDILEKQGGCNSAEWRRLFHASCENLVEGLNKSLDPGARSLRVSGLREYIASLTTKACPVGNAKMASVRKPSGSTSIQGVVDFLYFRAIGFTSPGVPEMCLYRENIPVLSLTCWNPIGGIRTAEEIGKPVASPPDIRYVERRATDTVEVRIGNSNFVAAGTLFGRGHTALSSISEYGYLRVIDVRTEEKLSPVKPDTVWKKRGIPWLPIIGVAIATSAVTWFIAYRSGQNHVECLSCKK